MTKSTRPEFIARLIKAAALHAGIGTNEITGKRKTKPACEARWACWLVMRDHGMTYEDIGRAFRRTHKAAMHGLARANEHRGVRQNGFLALCEAVRNA